MHGTKLLFLSFVVYVSGQSLSYYGSSNVRMQSGLSPGPPYMTSYTPNVGPVNPVYSPQYVNQPPPPDRTIPQPAYQPAVYQPAPNQRPPQPEPVPVPEASSYYSTTPATIQPTSEKVVFLPCTEAPTTTVTPEPIIAYHPTSYQIPPQQRPPQLTYQSNPIPAMREPEPVPMPESEIPSQPIYSPISPQTPIPEQLAPRPININRRTLSPWNWKPTQLTKAAAEISTEEIPTLVYPLSSSAATEPLKPQPYFAPRPLSTQEPIITPEQEPTSPEPIIPYHPVPIEPNTTVPLYQPPRPNQPMQTPWPNYLPQPPRANYRPQPSWPNYLPQPHEPIVLSAPTPIPEKARPNYQPLPPPAPVRPMPAIRRHSPLSANETLLPPTSYPKPVQSQSPPQPTTSFPVLMPTSIVTDPEIPDSIIPALDFECSKGNGYYLIVNECDSYIECQSERAYKHSCPDGLHFNSQAVYPEYPCAYPSEVKCESSASKQMARPTSQCPNWYGFFSEPGGDCSKYIMCQKGSATLMNCPLGLVFNEHLSSCDWPENVPQCNPNAFKNFTCPIPPEDDPDDLTRFRYGSDCSMYVACQRGQPRLLRCDPGMSFDEYSQVCMYTELVPECRRPIE